MYQHNQYSDLQEGAHQMVRKDLKVFFPRKGLKTPYQNSIVALFYIKVLCLVHTIMTQFSCASPNAMYRTFSIHLLVTAGHFLKLKKNCYKFAFCLIHCNNKGWKSIKKYSDFHIQYYFKLTNTYKLNKSTIFSLLDIQYHTYFTLRQ